MTVWIRDVDGVTNPATWKTRWTIFWTWDRYAHHSDGRCHTWSDWEASLCKEAKRLGVPVALETDATAWGPRVASVSLSQESSLAHP